MSMWTFLGVVGASCIGTVLANLILGWILLGGRDADE